MVTFDLNSEPYVELGLQRLSGEAFGPEGFAQHMDKVVHVLIHRRTSTFGHGQMVAGARLFYTGRSDTDRFSYEGLNVWLDECRLLAYTPGVGTWSTAVVHVFPDRAGQLELFDEELLERDNQGNWPPGGKPANAHTWTQQLLAFPRTADNIPSWMWDIFRTEEVTPPFYNPQFNSVDWKNRRRPVTDRGTDFTVEPTIIDPSLEPGVFAKIGKKLFGR
ncbi:hypothetical protein ACFUOZ_07745 [Paenarthrobacter sp. NPDC057355]|uniref:hypothetical protein n=1 Tax=Paenarthrobacter sp. NPDC057355 TaxID=3346105 RepID=UPI00363A8AD9